MSEQPTGRQAETRRRTTKVGTVTSDVCDKTVTVRVVTPVKHRRYHRIVRRTARFLAHDPQNRCKAGDMVEIRECRPLSKRKRWQVVRVLREAQIAGGPTQEVPGT